MKKNSNTVKQFLLIAIFIPLLLTLTSCASLLPTLTTIAVDFAKDLISTSAENHTPRYAKQVEKLFTHMITPSKSSAKKKSQDQKVQVSENQHEQESYSEDIQQVQSAQDDFNIALDIAVLVQRRSASQTSAPVPIQDGDTLYSDPYDPIAGDKLKLSFSANCDCYVYIIGIDATGYVVPVFPDYESNYSAIVTANQQHIIPKDDEWYGLDSYEGVEEFYFIASLEQRVDLENISKKFAKQVRKPRANYKPVTQAAIVPATRGIVKIKAGKPAAVQDSSGVEHSFTPMSFLSSVRGDDLVITRWFNHKNL